jgi:hypothetical protein
MGTAKSATVDAEELRDAFEFVSSGAPLENSAYICLDTGKIYWQSSVMDLDDEVLPETSIPPIATSPYLTRRSWTSADVWC